MMMLCTKMMSNIVASLPSENVVNGNMKKLVKVTPPRPRKKLQLAVIEPGLGSGVSSPDYILDNYLKTLAQRVKYHLGFPENIFYDHHAALAPLLQFHLNNCGDPFTENPVDFHSKDFEVAVLDWFAKLWEIDKDEYWGYVTHGGTEGNLHGIWIGRELLPNGILYTSKDSHYSVFKAARLYRIDLEMINTSTNGEMNYSDLKAKLLHNKDKPAIININIGTTFKGAMDDIDVILQTLEDCGYSHDKFYIHCDAALNGLIVPFTKNYNSLTAPPTSSGLLRRHHRTPPASPHSSINFSCSRDSKWDRCCKLPQQQNLSDCGLFLLHYVESFLEEDPAGINPYSIKNYHNEFPGDVSDSNRSEPR